ncbi:N-acetyltransferase family protein [Petrachloros mirabilis]
MNTTVRYAGPTDAAILSTMVGELLHEIMAVIGSPVFSFNREATEARAGQWLADGSYVVLLAVDRDAVVGFAALYESRALYAEGTFGTIPELYVRSGYRSNGVGARLLAEARTHAKARGWTRLEVTTPPLPPFDRTKTFYERHGFSVSGGRKLKADIP